MDYYYVLNLFVITLISCCVVIGAMAGLFSGSINLVGFIFSAGLGITLFERLGKLISECLCPNLDFSLALSLWLIFIVSYGAVLTLKSRLMRKVFESTRSWRVSFPAAMDTLGGGVCGLGLGLLIASLVILSLYIVPIPEKFYNSARVGEGVMLHVDEFLPRAQAAITQVLPPRARFDWESMLSKYKSRESKEEGQQSGEKETLTE